MPRVHFVKSARKPNPVAQPGESYYWWKFRFGGKRFSKTRPRPSQLTQSEYYSRIYSLQEYLEDMPMEIEDEAQFEEIKDHVYNELQEMYDEQEEKYSNMEEHGLEYTPTGEMVSERRDALESAVQEVECIDWEGSDREEHEDWEQREPQEHEYATTEEYEDALDEWQCDEPDEGEPMEISRFTECVEMALG